MRRTTRTSPQDSAGNDDKDVVIWQCPLSINYYLNEHGARKVTLEVFHVLHLLPSHFAMVATVCVRLLVGVESGVSSVYGRLQAELLRTPHAWWLQNVAGLIVLGLIDLASTTINRPLLANQSAIGSIPVLVHFHADASRRVAMEMSSDKIT